MANLTITNPGAADIFVGDLYATVPAGKSITVARAASDLPRMAGLQKLLADGSVTMTTALTADESASGLGSSSDVVEAVDHAPVAAEGLGGLLVLRKALAAGGGGAADDVTVYAVNTLPFKFRIVDAWGYISAGEANGRKIGLYTQAGGAGTLLAEVNAEATGKREQTAQVTATAAVTPAANLGLFARRSNSATAGEIFVVLRRES